MSEQPLPKPEQTNPTLEVQLATPEDAAGVFEVQRQTWINTYPNEEAGITEQDVRGRVEGEHGELVADKIAWWRKGIETSGENRAIFVVKDEDKVVGFVAPGIMDGQRRIGAIYVLPEAQGKGLGRKLLDKAIDWHGRDEDIYLHVASYNDNAIGFYEKNGFEKTGRAIEDLDARERGVVEIPEIEMVLKADGDSSDDWQAVEQQQGQNVDSHVPFNTESLKDRVSSISDVVEQARHSGAKVAEIPVWGAEALPINPGEVGVISTERLNGCHTTILAGKNEQGGSLVAMTHFPPELGSRRYAQAVHEHRDEFEQQGVALETVFTFVDSARFPEETAMLNTEFPDAHFYSAEYDSRNLDKKSQDYGKCVAVLDNSGEQAVLTVLTERGDQQITVGDKETNSSRT